MAQRCVVEELQQHLAMWNTKLMQFTNMMPSPFTIIICAVSRDSSKVSQPFTYPLYIQELDGDPKEMNTKNTSSSQ
ncbi:uncharacterized [Tachysurus ichikawai]